MLQGKAGSESSERDRFNLELKRGSNNSEFKVSSIELEMGGLNSAFYLAGHWEFPVGRDLITHLQPVIRYEHFSRSDRDRLNELRLLTVALSLLLDKHRSKCQVNYLKDFRTSSLKDELRAQYQIEFQTSHDRKSTPPLTILSHRFTLSPRYGACSRTAWGTPRTGGRHG